jgi:ribosomal protein L7/L12
MAKRTIDDLEDIEKILVKKLTLSELETLYGDDVYSAYWYVKSAYEYVLDNNNRPKINNNNGPTGPTGSIRLIDYGPSKMSVIKEVRYFFGCTLQYAKDIVDGKVLDNFLLKDAPINMVYDLESKLKALGAKVELL